MNNADSDPLLNAYRELKASAHRLAWRCRGIKTEGEIHADLLRRFYDGATQPQRTALVTSEHVATDPDVFRARCMARAVDAEAHELSRLARKLAANVPDALPSVPYDCAADAVTLLDVEGYLASLGSGSRREVCALSLLGFNSTEIAQMMNLPRTTFDRQYSDALASLRRVAQASE